VSPYFTIIMPLYNHAMYVGQAVESALEQTFGDFELVVCNDGSTDRSLAILDSYGDKRIRIVDKPNGGTVSALNACILNARGRYVCWLSSDDLFAPDKLKLHHEHHRAKPDSALSFAPFGYLRGGQAVPDVQVRPEPTARLAQFLEGNYVNGLSVCAHRALYAQYGLFDSRFRYAHDVERWFQFLARHEAACLEGSPQSYSRLLTSIVADADVLGELDVLKLVYTQLDGGGLKALLPESLRAEPLEAGVLVMLLMRLFSPTNLLLRYQLGADVINMVARSLKADKSQHLLPAVIGVLRDNVANDRARVVLEWVLLVERLVSQPTLEPGMSFVEQVCRLRDSAESESARRVLSRYLRQGL
jgi:glycosyltransferase involved in cell wall biosynthesis